MTKAGDGDAQTDLFGLPKRLSPKRSSGRSRATPVATSRAALTPTPTSRDLLVDGASLLNVRQAAVRLGLSKSTLDKMRCAGIGPRFIKSTDRAVRYDPADLAAWIEARRKQSTGD
jgi:predicted DNA-binding transcriptional regulator AlpA